MKPLKIGLDSRPNLARAMQESPTLAREVLATLMDLADESFSPDKGIRWADLPQHLHEKLTYRQLVTGIMRGTLDAREINPDSFDVLKAEVHPLSYFADRRSALDNSVRYARWRAHFAMPEGMPIDEVAIADIFRKLLRYARYVDIGALKQALESQQIASFRGLGERAVALLPMIPALRYQQKLFDDLHVGKFYDAVGAFDCGRLPERNDGKTCPACERPGMHHTDNYAICLDCNAGFRKEG